MRVDVTWPAPDDLGTPVMRVPEGTPIDLAVDLTSIDDGVLAAVSTAVDFDGECVRCLEPISRHHDVDVTEVFFEKDPRAGARRDEEDQEEDQLLLIEDDVVDLEPVLRDALVPLMDERPLCSPDCPGLCDVCGVPLAEAGPDHHHDVVDPRMAGLAALLDQMAGDDGADGTEGDPS